MTTATQPSYDIAVLPCLSMSGWFVRIGESHYHVEDCGDRYTFDKEGGGAITVYTGGDIHGKSCSCKAWYYRKTCRHMAAVGELAKRW